MEKNSWTAAALRRQILTSSPELRALESQLQACALKRDNFAAVAVKEAEKKVAQENDKKYAEMVECLDSEERLSSAISKAESYTKRLEIERILAEQIREKTARRAEAEAEKVLEMMSEIDEDKMLKKRERKCQPKIFKNFVKVPTRTRWQNKNCHIDWGKFSQPSYTIIYLPAERL
ncbi:meiosis-specific nuclear structural protein 1-like [Penaeus vannamei]|uniref:meiosis-specific nuclear structural protein 1-like n=1 Tax=Penaeus vannamei TaxID=6689 RepID=UPI00387F732A